MPELPEVETIRKQLQKYLVGYIIDDVEIRLPKQLSGDPKQIIGAVITGVRRYGKGLVIDLDNDYSLAIHIKMTGQLIFQEGKVGKVSKVSKAVLSDKVGELPGKATHVIFELRVENGELRNDSSKAYLYYNDVRQFGWIKVVKTSEVGELLFFKSLGPEFIPSTSSGAKQLTLAMFKKILASTKGPVKPLLMDQSKMAGVGNIYANEALWLAKIHPKQVANSLTQKEVGELFNSIEEVLKKGLEAGGSSEWAYVDALGQEGSYQKIFLVYGKIGKPCVRCGAKIEKIALGGRGTFFCAVCQVL